MDCGETPPPAFADQGGTAGAIHRGELGYPPPLALAFQAQDKVVYRELLAAREKANIAAAALPRGVRQRQVRYRVFESERQAVLNRYELDGATAVRILDWGKRGDWPTHDPKEAAKSDR